MLDNNVAILLINILLITIDKVKITFVSKLDYIICMFFLLGDNDGHEVHWTIICNHQTSNTGFCYLHVFASFSVSFSLQ